MLIRDNVCYAAPREGWQRHPFLLLAKKIERTSSFDCAQDRLPRLKAWGTRPKNGKHEVLKDQIRNGFGFLYFELGASQN